MELHFETLEEGDYLIWQPEKNRLWVLDKDKQIKDEFKPDIVLRTYLNKCPLFRYNNNECDNLKTSQYILDCALKKRVLTCKKTFSWLEKNKINVRDNSKSCRDCKFLYLGLVPPWETHNEELKEKGD